MKLLWLEITQKMWLMLVNLHMIYVRNVEIIGIHPGFDEKVG